MTDVIGLAFRSSERRLHFDELRTGDLEIIAGLFELAPRFFALTIDDGELGGDFIER